MGLRPGKSATLDSSSSEKVTVRPSVTPSAYAMFSFPAGADADQLLLVFRTERDRYLEMSRSVAEGKRERKR